jgi:hypothetical protein
MIYRHNCFQKLILRGTKRQVFLKTPQTQNKTNEKIYFVDTGEPGKYPEVIKSVKSAS